MPDHLGFLLDLLAARHNPHALAAPVDPAAIQRVARRHGIQLPTWDEEDWNPVEEDAATDALQELRTQLTTALVGEDPSAGREALNTALTAWHALLLVEEELGPDELPGVEVRATVLPPVPIRPGFHLRGDVPHGMAERCPTVADLVLATASILLSEASNIHLSGWSERVRACAALDCAAPFIDAGDAGRRRYCSARCRARSSARRRVAGTGPFTASRSPEP